MVDVIFRGFLFVVSIGMAAGLVAMWFAAGGLPRTPEEIVACIFINLMMLTGILLPLAMALDKELWN